MTQATEDKYKGQQILVIPNPTFLKDTPWIDNSFLPFFQAVTLPQFMLRKDAEENPAFRQIIPYAIIKSRKTGRYLTYERQGKETRLHKKISMGVGGHIDLEDVQSLGDQPLTLMHIVSAALAREILEEVPNIVTSGPAENNVAEVAGFIVSNKTEVDKVHLGVVVIQEIENEFVADSEEVAGVWVTKQELLQTYSETDQLETWAGIFVANCLNN